MIHADNIAKHPVRPISSLQKQITEIADALYHNKDEVHSANLLSGNAGITLFFAYLSKLYPDSNYEDIVFEYLDKLGNSLSEEILRHSMSGGIAGIAFVFQHLRNIGLLDQQEDLNLSELDEAISSGAELDFLEGRWDPLHGLVGLGIYFIERHKETGDKKYLGKIVDQIAGLSVIENGSIVWVTAGFRHHSKDNFNFGMAHGMPGLLSFLAQVHALDIRKPAIETMIRSCLPFLLSHRSGKQELYCFPGSIELAPDPESGKRKVHPSRHGWCYGDLGMANMLIHCGRSLNQEDWYQMGIDIALRTTNIPFYDSLCVDSSFCHGSLGLVHQYNRLYYATGDMQFKMAAGYWLDTTRNHYFQPDRFPGGYAFRSYNEETARHELISSFGLLEGIAGTGLVYLSCLHDIKPDWDIIFMTNI
jgi:class I lanthipeptide synthase